MRFRSHPFGRVNYATWRVNLRVNHTSARESWHVARESQHVARESHVNCISSACRIFPRDEPLRKGVTRRYVAVSLATVRGHARPGA